MQGRRSTRVWCKRTYSASRPRYAFSGASRGTSSYTSSEKGVAAVRTGKPAGVTSAYGAALRYRAASASRSGDCTSVLTLDNRPNKARHRSRPTPPTSNLFILTMASPRKFAQRCFRFCSNRIVSAFGPVLEHRDEIQTDQMREALLFPSRRLAPHLAAQGIRDLQFQGLASRK